jgi:hypothetical protein
VEPSATKDTGQKNRFQVSITEVAFASTKFSLLAFAQARTIPLIAYIFVGKVHQKNSKIG